jgi:hypothetical protein
VRRIIKLRIPIPQVTGKSSQVEYKEKLYAGASMFAYNCLQGENWVTGKFFREGYDDEKGMYLELDLIHYTTTCKTTVVWFC